jgi:hypothetical protein
MSFALGGADHLSDEVSLRTDWSQHGARCTRWLRHRTVPVIPIIGARKVAQLQDNLVSQFGSGAPCRAIAGPQWSKPSRPRISREASREGNGSRTQVRRHVGSPPYRTTVSSWIWMRAERCKLFFSTGGRKTLQSSDLVTTELREVPLGPLVEFELLRDRTSCTLNYICNFLGTRDVDRVARACDFDLVTWLAWHTSVRVRG